MTKTKIDEKNVFAVCDRIYIETGRDPTYEDITNELGGSNTTVKPFLQSWIGEPRPSRHPIPENLRATAEAFVQVIWGNSLTAAEQVVLPAKRQSEESLKRCQDQLDEAIHAIGEIEQHRDILKAENKDLMTTCAELQVKLNATGAIKARCDGLETLAQTLREERDAALLQASSAHGQIAALERQIAAFLSSIQAQPRTRRVNRKNAPAELSNAGA